MVMKRISYLGPHGSNSEQAFKKYIGNNQKIVEIQHNSIEAAIISLESDECDEAIVPIENSIEGCVNVTLDMLGASNSIKIISEITISIQHRLMFKKGVNISKIKYIISHPQAIAQCRSYILKTYPDVEIIYANSTSEAAKITSESKGEFAAIASTLAANIYNLEIVDKDIQDVKNNITRFVVLSKKECNLEESKKITMMFSVEDRPGSLVDVLDVFKKYNVNLSKIESRPSKKILGEYIFFIEINMNMMEPLFEEILQKLEIFTREFKILGAFTTLIH